MKKIVAFSVLLVLLSAAVFAQDDGSGWKIGFTAQLGRDFFYSKKTTGEFEQKIATSPAEDTDGTNKGKLGDYIKGSSNMWAKTGLPTGDKRLIVSLSNSGEHYKVYIDAKLDDSWLSGFTLMNLLSGDAADWEFSGDTGASGAAVVFDGKVGTGRYGGFVPAYELWNDWIDSAGKNFFGVNTNSAFQPSNNISNANINGSPWDTVYAIGATFGGNFKLAIGSTLDTFASGYDNGVASASAVTGAFMLSGKNLGPLAFDLFYAINGGDKNTGLRGTGEWDNLLGAYIGLNIVENLGLSIGYTAYFTKYETDQIDNSAPGATKPNYIPYEKEGPVWSGVDIKINYSGIDKIGITFNNNLSFAGVAGGEVKNKDDKRILGLNGDILTVGGNADVEGKINTNTENWFAWTAVLGVSCSLTDNLSVTFAISNELKVFSTEYETYKTAGAKTDNDKTTNTSDDFRLAVFAQYGVGNVTFGLGIQLWANTDSLETVSNSTYTGGSYDETFKGSLSTVKFGIPIFFKVSI